MSAAQILTIVAASLAFLAVAVAVGAAIVAAFREFDDPYADDDEEEV